MEGWEGEERVQGGRLNRIDMEWKARKERKVGKERKDGKE